MQLIEQGKNEYDTKAKESITTTLENMLEEIQNTTAQVCVLIKTILVLLLKNH